MTTPTPSITAFAPFYAHVLPEGEVRAALRDVAAPVVAAGAADRLPDDIRQAVLALVERHSYRTLIAEFHAFREAMGLPMTAEDDRALTLFRQRLADAGFCARILDRYPVLRHRLTTIRRSALAAYREPFAAYAADRSALVAAGLLRGPAAEVRITAVVGTGSDPHNGGRQIVHVETTSGERVVFKPRPLQADAFVRDVFAVADRHLRHSLIECVPQSVTTGTHGWQRFVPARPMTSADEVARYFYRFGALCAIFGAIGTSDLHHENLIAVGEHPCVVDTETVLNPDAGVDNDSLPHTLINQMKLSVGSTMLVPARHPASPIDVIMAGVGVVGAQRSKVRQPTVLDAGTDAIRVTRERAGEFRHDTNMPRLGDQPVSAVDHYADLLDGYTDGLEVVRGTELPKIIDAHAEMPLRALMRATMVYATFLDASTHPKYLRRQEDTDRLLSLLTLSPDHFGAAAADLVCDVERATLRRGDIPYFVSRANSRVLSTRDILEVATYRHSPAEFARLGIELNGGRPDEFHHFLLEESFSELCGTDRRAGLWEHSVFGRATLPAAVPGGWWEDIAEVIESVAVPFAGPAGTELGWLGGVGPGAEAPTLTPGNFISFHDMGGVAAYLARAARFAPELAAARDGAARGFASLLAEHFDAMTRQPASVFSGAASVVFTAPRAAQPALLDRIFTVIGERAGELDADMGGGPAGLLMVLLARVAAGEPACSAARLAGLRDLLVAHLAAPTTRPWFDVAHGELGLRWASARLGRVTGDREPAAAAADWLVDRWESGQAPAERGWCKGTAGLLLAAAEIMAAAGRLDWLAGRRLARLVSEATRLPTEGPVDLSVCHGSSGVVQCLLAAGQVLGDASLRTRAWEYQAGVLDHVRRHGFFTGGAGKTALLGYHLGWAGVGDTDLILRADGELPIPLALPATLLP